MSFPGAVGYVISFDLQSDTETNSDFAYVRNGYGTVIATYTGSNWPSIYVASSNGISFKFTSDNSAQSWGFLVMITPWRVNPTQTSPPTLRPTPQPSAPTFLPTSLKPTVNPSSSAPSSSSPTRGLIDYLQLPRATPVFVRTPERVAIMLLCSLNSI